MKLPFMFFSLVVSLYTKATQRGYDYDNSPSNKKNDLQISDYQTTNISSNQVDSLEKLYKLGIVKTIKSTNAQNCTGGLSDGPR